MGEAAASGGRQLLALRAVTPAAAPAARLPTDKLTVESDVQRADAVASVFARFFSNYKAKHLPVARAAHPASRSVFALWEDEEVSLAVWLACLPGSIRAMPLPCHNEMAPRTMNAGHHEARAL